VHANLLIPNGQKCKAVLLYTRGAKGGVRSAAARIWAQLADAQAR
jgi:hypothetical protein